MRYLLVFLLFSNFLFAGSVQFGTGGLTVHFSDRKKSYCNQWNDTGIIANKTYYVRFMANEVGFSYLQGNDSICSKIEGLFLHYMYDHYEYVDLGVTVGGYSFHMSEWEKHAEETPEDIASPEPFNTKIDGKDVVPVLALEVDVHLIRKENWSLKLNNLFTPLIFNHSIAYEYRF